MAINLTPVENSSLLTGQRYDSESRTLRVQFRNGTVGEYLGVDPLVYQTFLEAPSQGKYLKAVIEPAAPYSVVKDDED